MCTQQVAAAYRAGAEAAGRDPGELVCRFFVLPGDEGHELARMMFVNYGSVPVYTEFFRWLGLAARPGPDGGGVSGR